MAKHKIGDKFELFGETKEIVGIHENSDQVRYWVAYRNSTDLATVSECYVDKNWTKIEPFFEVGKAYRWKRGGGTTYTVDTVRGEGDKRVALAKTSFGKWDLLTANDYDHAEEVN